jgi:hypothetical protein
MRALVALATRYAACLVSALLRQPLPMPPTPARTPAQYRAAEREREGERIAPPTAPADQSGATAGGGASLELLEGQILPGVAALDSA